jgi:hypothetical protein
MSDADLVYLPWVRRGAAAALLDPDRFTSDQPGLAAATASVTINSGPSASVPVTVMGPGHVTGLDRRQVVRTDPAPGSRTFEPNYFPLVELDEPSLPWLFTPAGAGAQNRLRPWLCLVVVRLQAGVRLDPPTSGPLPVLRISAPADPAAELPDLEDSWAWAHGQVTSEVGVSIETQLAGNPERTLSRLLCSRILRPDTEYLACVVPTFELGCKAGLGQKITADDESHLEPAWTPSASTVELPVYYSWSFATGAGGDFQSLAMLLRARPLPPGIGVQPVDVGKSGLPADIPPGTTVLVGGALQPVGSSPGGWSAAALQAAWEDALRPVLNAPATVVATEDPLLAPPLYGATQARVVQLDTGTPGRWFEQLNLAPAHRAVAHLGTRVVQEQQEALMASAWEQAAQLEKVNQLRRQAQLGWRVASSLHSRHVSQMDPAVGLQVLAPTQPRLLRRSGALAGLIVDTGLQTAAYSTALRRVARPRGALNRRLQRVAPTPLPRTTRVLLKLQPSQVLGRMVLPAAGPITLERVAAGLVNDVSWGEGTAAAVATAPKRPFFAFVPLGSPVPVKATTLDATPLDAIDARVLPIRRRAAARIGRLPPEPPEPPEPEPPRPPRPPRPVDSEAAKLFRQVAGAQLARFMPDRPIKAVPPLRNGQLAVAFAAALARTNPTETFAARARAVFTIAGESANDDAALAPVGLSPVFPQPMVEPLVEVAQELVLPGLELVPPNTVVPLETNTRFVQAYLVGLNTEMGRELLWRGFPADLSATYFDRFWDSSASPGRPPDIDPVSAWGGRGLGEGAGDENFVMLVRSELLLRYPDAIVYATRAGEERHPIFTGRFAPDVRYFGFEIGVDDIGDWSIVIQEHPSAPRFGVEVGTDHGTATHVPPPKENAALIAHQTRQMPVRITLPATVLGLS